MKGALAALILVPTAAGLAATLLPAFAYFPAIGAATPSLAPWHALLAWPGFAASLGLTLRTGLIATAFALLTALAIATHPRARVWPPLLAMPHAATAIGLAFLIAPSGWIARLLGQWPTPPNLTTVGDPFGWALILGLWLKETPYLLLATLAALAQTDPEPKLRAAASLGLPRHRAWPRIILPLVWPQLRLPLAAVLAYALTSVDMALILAPNTPPTLAVQTLRWFTDPDLSLWLQASAAATLLAIVTGALILPIFLAPTPTRLPPTPNLVIALTTIATAAIATLVLWSFAETWRFPAVLPAAWTLAAWQTHFPGAETANTITLGLAATILAISLAIAHLATTRGAGQGTLALLHIPLLVPQIGFLFGLQTLLLRTPLAGTQAAVVLTHLLFVLPYVMFALAGPWRALNPNLARGAASLGAHPLTTLRRITLPLLRKPLAAAGAIGFAVSCTLYLPTLFAAGGRIQTLATEAIALASGTDRRITAIVALSQAALPLAGFAIAAFAGRERRGQNPARVSRP